MSNTDEKLNTPADVMQMAMVVGPRASIQYVRLVNVSAMLGEFPPESLNFVRHRRTSSFSRGPNGRLDVDIRFALDIATNEEEKNEPPVSIEGKYRLTYKIDDLSSLDDDHIKAFAHVNGYFNAWPYWRELTTNMLARTQAGFFVLPTLRVETTEETVSSKP